MPPFLFAMRRLLALLLLLPGSAMAQIAPTQNNDNTAVGQASSNQSNESRSESIGGSLNNYQFNNSQGELGEMTIGGSAISCQSPSLYANAGVIPGDAFGFYTFENRERQMMYAPQAQVGFQMPFGPQVATCTQAMKNKATQVAMGTESGIVAKCVELKIATTKAEIALETVAKNFPVLKDKCSALWGVPPTSRFEL